MDQRDLLFLVLIAITGTSLVVFIAQFFRSRKGGSGRRGWWEGPWDEDRKD